MPLRLSGRQVELMSKWTPTVLAYGGGASLALFYVTEWKVICRYIPFYGSKFD